MSCRIARAEGTPSKCLWCSTNTLDRKHELRRLGTFTVKVTLEMVFGWEAVWRLSTFRLTGPARDLLVIHCAPWRCNAVEDKTSSAAICTRHHVSKNQTNSFFKVFLVATTSQITKNFLKIVQEKNQHFHVLQHLDTDKGNMLFISVQDVYIKIVHWLITSFHSIPFSIIIFFL